MSPVPPLLVSGVQGWRSGESTRLPPMWPTVGSIPRLGVICGLSLLVLYSAPRGFLRVLRFPLSSKTNIWLVVFIVNFTLQCPQLVLQS